MVEHYLAGIHAREEGDFATYREEMSAALEIEPGHPILQIHLARACAGLDRPDASAGWLHRAFDQGAWLEPRNDEWFEPLHDAAVWPRILDRADSVGRHYGPGRVGLALAEFDLMPEGIEYDPHTDRFLLGSTRRRRILSVGREGETSDLVAPGQDGLLAVLGLRVDPSRRRLWAVSWGSEEVTEFEEDDVGRSRLHCWSLEDGSLLGRWEAPADSTRHAFNDLALRPDGGVVVTDALAGALFAARVDSPALETILPAQSLRGPNGIAISADGRVAWVSEYVYGVARVDLDSHEYTAVDVPDTIAFIGIDGLYRRNDELVAVQNYAGLDRVAAFRLDAMGHKVESVRILESHHPKMDDPTTGVIVGDEFWYIANSHIAGFDRTTTEPNAEHWGPVLVLRVPL
jgi:sugar lactone lactonase YvrE